MPWYAQINADGNVIAVSNLTGTVDDPNVIAIADPDTVVMGQHWNGTGWDPVAPQATLTVSLDQDVVSAGTTVTATVEVRLPDNSFAPITAAYFVPVFGADGRQATLLTVPVGGGQATVPFVITTPGIYTVQTNMIRPVPTAILVGTPELIVTGG